MRHTIELVVTILVLLCAGWINTIVIWKTTTESAKLDEKVKLEFSSDNLANSSEPNKLSLTTPKIPTAPTPLTMPVDPSEYESGTPWYYQPQNTVNVSYLPNLLIGKNQTSNPVSTWDSISSFWLAWLGNSTDDWSRDWALAPLDTNLTFSQSEVNVKILANFNIIPLYQT